MNLSPMDTRSYGNPGTTSGKPSSTLVSSELLVLLSSPLSHPECPSKSQLAALSLVSLKVSCLPGIWIIGPAQGKHSRKGSVGISDERRLQNSHQGALLVSPIPHNHHHWGGETTVGSTRLGGRGGGEPWSHEGTRSACLLSSLLSMRSWVWLAEVRAEKMMKWLMYSSGRFFRSLSEMVRVLPVPVGPMHSTWECGGLYRAQCRAGASHPDLSLGVG